MNNRRSNSRTISGKPRKPWIPALRAPLKRAFLSTFLLCGSCATLMAQGYMYTFVGSPGNQLDGSYVVLSNAVPGAPALADLLAVKILDSFPGPGAAVFDVTVSLAGFNITSFGAQGFNGSISGSAQSYFPPTMVTLAGMDSTPGITASNNGFFPGNPQGEAVFGNWVVTPVPEPKTLSLVLLGVAGLAVRRKCLKSHAGHAAQAAQLPFPDRRLQSPGPGRVADEKKKLT